VATYVPVLTRLGSARRERAQQLFACLVVSSHQVAQPREFEREFHRCTQVFSKEAK
jgi:hypothetical protein